MNHKLNNFQNLFFFLICLLDNVNNVMNIVDMSNRFHQLILHIERHNQNIIFPLLGDRPSVFESEL